MVLTATCLITACSGLSQMKLKSRHFENYPISGNQKPLRAFSPTYGVFRAVRLHTFTHDRPLAVGQNWQDDQRVILFVKLAPGLTLTDELQDKIRKTLRENASPRHVPAVILEAPEIPYTLNMKKVESAVTNILNGRPVANQEALINPASLEFYRQAAEKLKE